MGYIWGYDPLTGFFINSRDIEEDLFLQFQSKVATPGTLPKKLAGLEIFLSVFFWFWN